MLGQVYVSKYCGCTAWCVIEHHVTHVLTLLPFQLLLLLQDLSQEDLLTEAAGMAPVSAWRKAAAAAAATAPASALQHQRRSSSSREGSSSPRDQGSGALRQEVQILWQMGRKALRATVIAIHLLQQQQQQQGIVPSSTAGAGAGTAAVLPKQYRPGLGAVAYRKEALLNHLGVTLLDQASCLSPWFEPWRFRPQRTPLRLLMLDAAKVCVVHQFG